MLLALSLAGAVALSTADICDNPVKEPSRPEDYGQCRLSAPRRVETPYFSIALDSRFLVTLDQAGRRMGIGFSQHQNMAGLSILVFPNEKLRAPEIQHDASALWLYTNGNLKCESRILGDTSWSWCVQDNWKEEFLPQYYFLKTTANVYCVEHYTSGVGREMDSVLEELLQSITVHEI